MIRSRLAARARTMAYSVAAFFIFTVATAPLLRGQEPSSSILYSTYFGGAGTDDCDAVAVDGRGNTYLGCHSNSSKLPGFSEHPYALVGGMDAFVAKLNREGSKVVYLSHLGGSKWDAVQSLLVDPHGNVYAVGSTYSRNFPASDGSFQPKFGGESDAFVTKLDGEGNVLWTSFLGGRGDEDGRDLALDQDGNLHIVGRTESSDFPTTDGAFQGYSGSTDAFVATFDPSGRLLASTLLGGAGEDIGFAIAVDKHGRLVLAGTTNSADFPVRNAPYPSRQGGDDAFVAVLNPTGTTLEFASYLGGSGTERGYGLGVDPSGHVFLAGTTDSPDFPVTNGALQQVLAGETDTFVARFDVRSSKVDFATYIGGTGEDRLRKLLVEPSGRAVFVGKTSSPDFPVPVRHELQGTADAFLAVLEPSGSKLAYGLLVGGEGLDTFEGAALGVDGSLTVSGLTAAPDYLTVNALQDSFSGGRFDIVVGRFELQ